jgi:hypothetical protein
MGFYPSSDDLPWIIPNLERTVKEELRTIKAILGSLGNTLRFSLIFPLHNSCRSLWLHSIVLILTSKMSALSNFFYSTVTYDTVRAEMKRVLTPQERKSHRGITKVAMTGVKYDELFGISTAEELITAELYGRKAIPSDDPENLYLFSVGHGLTARCNPEFFASIRHQDAGFVLHQTIAELHDEYITQPRKSTPEDREFVESSLNAAATGSTSWWNGLILGSQTLTRRQQGYYCKNKGQVCGNTDDCSKIKTIQRLLCECTASNTCQTDNLPVPPYEPPSCPYHNCQS